MYNVFKRPMFKRGGTAQGSGIMSTVEPRQQYKEAGPVYPFEKRSAQELLNITSNWKSRKSWIKYIKTGR
jgi:hypothetical protein